MAYNISPNEKSRLAALRALEIVRQGRSADFDAIVDLAAELFECPITLVSLIEEEEAWFIARHGLALSSVPRNTCFCQFTIASDALFIVPDALDDPRFCDSAYVKGEPHVRFYAGCPLSLDGVSRLGALCVLDTRPREFSDQQKKLLRWLATLAEGLLRARQHALNSINASQEALAFKHEAELQACLMNEFAKISGVGGWTMDVKDGSLSLTEQTKSIHDIEADAEPDLEQMLEFFASEGRKRIRQALDTGMRDGEGWDLELPLRTAKGREIWVNTIGSPVLENGDVVRLVGAYQDITERKLSLDRATDSESLYRSTLNALSEGILVLDFDGTLRSYNPSAELILQTELGSQEPLNVRDLDISFATEPGEAGPFVDAVETANGFRNRMARFECKQSDQSKWLNVSAEPIVNDEGGDALGVVISFTDITKTKQSQEILQEAIEAIPDGFAIYDELDRLLICNAAYNRTFKPFSGNPARRPSYVDIMRNCLRRGVFGNVGSSRHEHRAWLGERLSRHRTSEESIVQQMADQRWLQIRQKSTKSGYLVEVDSDVTAIKRQSDTLQTVFDNFPGGVVFFDHDLLLAGCNEQFKIMLGLDQAFIDSKPTFEAYLRLNAERGEYGEGDVEEKVRERLNLAKMGVPHAYERTRPDGRVLEIKGTPIPGGGFVTTFNDITTRKKTERNLIENERYAQEKKQELEVMLANMNQGVSVFDKDSRLYLWNDRYIEIFGKPPGEVHFGVRLTDLISVQQTRGAQQEDVMYDLDQLLARLANGETVRTVTHLPNGRIVATSHAPMPGGGWVGTHDDITEQERASARILHAAHHDTLTGLANRTLFNLEMEKAVEAASADKPSYALMLVDLDRFKYVNDSFGHATGDKLLQEVSERLGQCVRPNDIVARLGGDEFAVIFRELKNAKQSLQAIAKRVVETLDEVFLIDGNTIDISASVGVSLIRPGDIDVETVLHEADSALYKVKHAGRNGYRFFDRQIGREIKTRHSIEAGLRDAAERKAFELHYQPLVRLHDRSTVGYEALVRWNHPEFGAVQPGEFIPIAEDVGLIARIGSWILDEAIETATRWHDSMRLAVNISPRQLGHGQLVQQIQTTLARTGFRADTLELEVTEGVLLNNDETTIEELRAIQALGVRVVLDDFGSGFSSLAHLRNFPFDVLKIDRSLVAGSDKDPQSAALISSVASLASVYGMDVAAEGIETEEQLKLAHLAGCNFGQGYLLGRPVASDALNHTSEAPGLEASAG